MAVHVYGISSESFTWQAFQRHATSDVRATICCRPILSYASESAFSDEPQLHAAQTTNTLLFCRYKPRSNKLTSVLHSKCAKCERIHHL